MHPLQLAQVRAVPDDVLVCGQQHLETTHPQLGLQLPSLRWIPFVRHCLHRWGPLSKLSRPIGHCRQGNNDEIRASLLLALNEKCDKGNRLNSFSESLSGVLSNALLSEQTRYSPFRQQGYRSICYCTN